MSKYILQEETAHWTGNRFVGLKGLRLSTHGGWLLGKRREEFVHGEVGIGTRTMNELHLLHALGEDG